VVSRLTPRERAWWQVDERHGDELRELSAMARAAGPDVAFVAFLHGLQNCPSPEAYDAAMKPLFQSALMVAAEIGHRRAEFDKRHPPRAWER